MNSEEFLHKCFAWSDRDNKGFLSAHDLKCAVAAALGVRPSKLRFFGTRLVSTDLLEDVRRIFKALDIRAQGFISLRSFQQACEMALPLGKHETLLCAFHEADRDGDGRVTYQDFERMCLLAVQITEMSKPTIL
ncbi:ef-hand calcium-binding domain-containing protein 11 [Plasmopara halstedii]|uniref:Ef-hand calcium-binding domain-containing protein 11 n=1 Tax=Plasmopara halstedii TaxID=4781 RepID=A0A0P1A595_PLAHL|nr:ef-hand calcium-binding domain-containing protein 11 [Plasmopara halstedii]CEG35497.1 ef-hand calcium-binding domain-containing protein 11 [Plasmopara halstedii]|eukprot:XP_024571866.1 ef-hand calcium-binding domain-containing protein 11 [Plasmopara halstedii]